MTCHFLPRRVAARELRAAPAIAGFRPAAAVLALAAAFSAPVLAQPTGGVAVHGSASFAQDGNKFVVTTRNGAGTSHSAINWQSFSIPAGQVTQFVQPGANSTAINRVLTSDPSRIFGTLISNGRLVLVNPAGITVGAGAVVDTAAFTASTLRMADADAMAGRLVFGDGGLTGSLVVDGRILARSGDVVLLAPSVQAGAGALVQSPNGATLLAAGRRIALTGRGLEGIQLEVQAPADSAVNLGTLNGDAVGMFAGTLKHSGLVVADAVTSEGGKVVLRGQAQAELAGTVVARKGALGGEVQATASRVLVRDGAVIDVSGPAGGGEALLGGGWQGKDARLANAQDTILESGSVVRANATSAGAGGTVVAWADGTTRMGGRIEAKGGADGGNGGAVETSGKKQLVFRGTVDTSAPHGQAGKVLLDPQDIIIANGSGAQDDASLSDSSVDGSDANSATDVTISEAALESNAIVGSSITLQASRDVIFQDLADNLLDLTTVTAGKSFAIQAGRDIKLATTGGDVNDRIRTNGGNIQFTTAAGAIDLGGVITRGGSVAMSAGGVLGTLRLREVNTTPGSGNGGAVSLVASGSGAMLLGDIDTRYGGGGTKGAIRLDAQGAVQVTAGRSIQGGHLQLSAVGGFTDDAGAAASTAVSSFNASNSGSGDIRIANTGSLDIADPDTLGYGVQQASGSGKVEVATTGGGLNVLADVRTQGGDISLASPDTGVRVVGSTVAAAGGNVLLSASGYNSYHSVEIVNNGATRSAVSTTGTGTITLNGTLSGGGFSAGSGAGGVVVTNSTVSAGTGAIAITGKVTNGVTVSGRGFQLNSGALVTSQGNITLDGDMRSTNTGFTGYGGEIANGATIASSGGNVLLKGFFNNPSALAGVGLGVSGRVQASTGSISLQGTSSVGPSSGHGVLIGSTGSLDAGALGLTVTGTVSSSTTATAIIGASLGYGSTVTSSGNVAITGAASAPSASGVTGVSVGSSLTTTGAGTITITGSGTPAPAPASSRDVDIAGTTVASAGGQITIMGERIAIQSYVNSGAGNTVIAPTSNNRAITLGGSDETGALNLSASELDLITAGTLVIGSATHTGGISIGGAITRSAGQALRLQTASAISQTAAMTVASLAAQGASVNLTNAGNQFVTVSGRATSGAFNLASASAFDVGSVGGVTGLTGATGNTVNLQSSGLLTVSSSIASAGGTLALKGNGVTLGTGSTLSAANVSLDGAGSGSLNLGGGTIAAGTSLTLANGGSATLGNLVGGGDLTINALSGPVTQAAGTMLDVGTLAGSGNGGTITLANAGNQVDAIDALAADGGVTVRDAVGDLSLAGAVAGGSGQVLLTTTGNLLQSQSVSSNASGDAVVLAAGGSYTNAAGSGAIATPGGRWLVYSADPAADGFGGLVSGNTAVYNATYDSVAPASIAAGNRYVFAYQPNVSVTADAQSRVYDGSAGFGSLTYAASLVDAAAYDNVFLPDSFSGTLGLGSTGRNVGTYSIVQGTLAAPAGYAMSYTGADAVITPAPLMLAAVSDTRVYDGGTASGQAVLVTGLASGDTVASLSQSFASRNVLGTGASTLLVNGGYVVNDGNGGANYTTTSTGTAAGTITPAPLALNAVSDSRAYDGTTASLQAPSSSGLMGGDTVASLSQSFASRNVLGTGASTLLVNGGYVVNDGNGGANYTVGTNTAAGTITPAPLAINAVSDSRVYDGTTASALTPSSGGLMVGDTLSSLWQAFASRNVQGTGGSTLQVGGYTVNDGNGGANYTVATNTAAGTITPASLALNAVGDSRVYDGTTASALTPTSSGLVGGDSLSSLWQAFASKNVLGTGGSTLQVGGYAVNDGNGGANYAVATNTAAGTITPAPLALNAVGDSRAYDGTTVSLQAPSAAGLLGGDTMSSLSQSFASRNVLGTGGSTLQVDGAYVVNDGNGGANYTVATNTAAGTITPAPLTLNAVTDSRVYDGTTASSQTVTTNGLVGGDTLSSLSQSFASRNVLGTGGSTLLVDGGYVVNDGNGGANYTVATNTAAGTITPASLTLNAVTDSRVYDGTAASSLAPSSAGLVGGDMVSSLSQSFASRNVLGTGGSTLLVDGGYVVNDGNGGANYTVATNSAAGTITPASLTLNAVTDSRAYDGTTASSQTVTANGLVGGDTVASLSQSFASRNVLGTGGSTLQVDGGYAVNDGNGGANYTTATNTAIGTITPAALTLNAVTDSRVYDGTTASSQTVTTSGLVGGDTVASLSQSFASRNVLGTGGSTLQVDGGYALNDGNGGANYTVSTNTAGGTITPAALTLNAVTDSRVYDGTTASSQTVTTSGLVGGDTVTSLSQSFASRNVLGTGGSTLQVDGGYALSDGNGGANYTVSTNTAGGTITPAALTLNAATDSRVYDGTTASSQTVTTSGLVGGDTVASLSQSFASRNVLGTGGSTLQVDGGYALNDGNGGANYTVAINTAAGTITPAALTLDAVTDSRVYDGTTASSLAPVTAGLVGGDTVASLSQSFASRNVLGTGGSTLQVDGYKVNDGNGGANYTVATNTAAGTITPAPLTLNAVADSRMYDATTASSRAPYADGLLASDTVSSLSQSFASRNALGTQGSTLQVNGGYAVDDGNGGANYTVATNTAAGTITPASLTLNAVTDSRAYDGTTDSSQTVATSGLLGGDTVSALSQAFTSRHVLGTGGSTLAVNGGYVVNDGNGGGNYAVATGTAPGTLSPAAVTLSVDDISRVYDGTTVAGGTAVVRGGTLFAPDSLAGGSFAFADRNAGTGKTVSVAGVTVNDGNGGANYSVSYAPNFNGSIAQRPLSTWSGAAGDGLWSSAGNWDALPDASNVLGVAIPAGAFVTYDLAGVTSLQSLASGGGFGLASGTLLVAQSARTQRYSQSGGTLAGAGSLQVDEFFAQAGGAIDLRGAVDITQAAGDLAPGSIHAASIALKAGSGSITQGGPLVASGLLSASAQGSIVLDDAGNRVAAFEAASSGPGSIAFTNTGALDLRSVSAANGSIAVVNTAAIQTSGLVSASGGGVSLTANSPLFVGTAGIETTGDIVLVASNLTSAGQMTLDGPVVSSAGEVHLTAGADLVQNQLVQGANGVTASAEGAIRFGPSAITVGTPVSYTAAGQPVTPPGGSLAREVVQLQNQQLAGDLLQLETVASLFVDEAERQRLENKEEGGGVTFTDTQCRR